MTRLSDCRLRTTVFLLLVFLLRCDISSAQSYQFLPEVDACSRIAPDIRFNFQLKETREAGDPTQAEIGPGFDFFLKPLVRLKKVTTRELDESESRPVQFSIGFRYVPSPHKPHLERMELAITTRFPLAAKILLSDRSRADLDWSKGQFTWENAVLGIGFQFFNVFNHPNFLSPDNTLSDGTFGQITYVAQPPTSILGSFLGGDSSARMIQLKAQIQF